MAITWRVSWPEGRGEAMSEPDFEVYVALMSLDVTSLDVERRIVTFRYSADGIAGAVTGDISLPIQEGDLMTQQLFSRLSQDVLSRAGTMANNELITNLAEIEPLLLSFLSNFDRVADVLESESSDLAMARTDGIDFLSKQVSLYGKEIPERVSILLRRATSNLEYGYDDESFRELAKIDILEPGNPEARALRKKAMASPKKAAGKKKRRH